MDWKNLKNEFAAFLNEIETQRAWSGHRGVTLDFSRPGKSNDNAFIEAIDGKFRQECLNAHWFMTLAVSCEKMEAWRRYDNQYRPKCAIEYNVPASLTKPSGKSDPLV